ncbi:aftiphilin isoform X1 [Amia ocellicauda]|uniref:aftiphilin isoform X1 n=1 Tax=Amia ocellicauda TaxID=2972642 RepID=UPI003463F286
MEPEVIRMYSSSPPPLDDGAEEDDDEFGEFGGFSGVSASVSLTEFDTPGFVPPNHFLPEKDYSNNVDGFADFNSGPLGKERGPSVETTIVPDASLRGLETGTDNDLSWPVKPVIMEGTGMKEELRKLADQNDPNPFMNSSADEASSRTDVKNQPHPAQDCNGGVVKEILTNGFAGLETQHSCPQATGKLAGITDPKRQLNISPEPAVNLSPPSPEDKFADFSAFPSADASADSTQTIGTRDHREGSSQGETLTSQDSSLANSVNELHIPGLAEVSSENDGVRDVHSTGSDPSNFLAVAMEGLSNGERESETVEHTDPAVPGRRETEPDAVHQTAGALHNTDQCATQNGQEETRAEELGVCASASVFPSRCGDEADGRLGSRQGAEDEDREGESTVLSTSASVSEEFASFCQAISPDGLEDFWEFSTTSGLSSQPLSEAAPAPQGLEPKGSAEQVKEPEDEDFGDFGDAEAFESKGFADFSRPEGDRASPQEPEECETQEESIEFSKETSRETNDDFGDFDEAHEPKGGEEEFADFPISDGFADFNSAPGSQDGGWKAFGEQSQSGGDSWAAFGEEQTAESTEGQRWESDSAVTGAPTSSPQSSRKDPPAFASFQDADIESSPEQHEAQKTILVSRLERLFLASFPSAPVLEADEDIPSLEILLGPGERESKESKTLAPHGELREVWRELQDIHDAYGLKYQWGGSHSNKKLLCSLGIDTRNILFTGQKKQPVIVPMYAASLGMLEPTKEPVKPISAAEKIASIAQAPPVSPDMSTCSPDQTQETLPPVQFDWSSSGLTNPLDASGGSTLLNLDFFGPVDDSSSSSTTTIPGVDPELYELTTAKLDNTSSSSRVADAFARLMSTVEKTSTSARKPRKDENLSEEAAKVIASLPDLSFMQAKVLMFPTTLTPLTSQQDTAE